MSISKWWAEAKGMTWPTQKPVQTGAQNAGFFAMMSAYPMMREAIDAVLEGGTAGIAELILQMNFGEGGMGDTFKQGWNDYVREYRKCRKDPDGYGAYNFHGYSSLQANCLEHAKRYVEYQYPWPERAFDTGTVQGPREETWGYEQTSTPTTPTQPFGAALRVVTGAAVKGGGPVARSVRRDVSKGLLAIRGGIPGPATASTPAAPAEPSPAPSSPAPVSPYTFDTGSIGQYWWLLLPAGLILLSRRS